MTCIWKVSQLFLFLCWQMIMNLFAAALSLRFFVQNIQRSEINCALFCLISAPYKHVSSECPCVEFWLTHRSFRLCNPWQFIICIWHHWLHVMNVRCSSHLCWDEFYSLIKIGNIVSRKVWANAWQAAAEAFVFFVFFQHNFVLEVFSSQFIEPILPRIWCLNKA